MRCKNCGWNNPADALVCEKCRAKLTSHNPNRPSAYRPGDDRALGLTPTVMGSTGMPKFSIPENPRVMTPNNRNLNDAIGSPAAGVKAPQPMAGHFPGLCPTCSYPISELMDSCPNCGLDLTPYKQAAEKKQEPASKASSKSDSDDGADSNEAIYGKCNATLVGHNSRLDNAQGDREDDDVAKSDGVIIEPYDDEWTVEAAEGHDVYIRVNKDKFRLISGDELLIDGEKYFFKAGRLHKS